MFVNVPVGVGFGISVVDDGDLVGGDELVERSLVFNFGGNVTNSLLNPRNDLFVGSSSSIVDGGSVCEEFKSGVALDSEFLSEFSVFGGINFS